MKTVVYLAGQLPKRSETFVYRELFGLRAAGVRVLAATLHPPEANLGEPRLDALAAEAIPVYGLGRCALLRDAALELRRDPARTLRLLGRAVMDALTATDLTLSGRVKTPAQAVAALALASRLRDQSPDHLHAHFAHAPATVAMYTAMQLGVPFSFTGHAVDLYRDRALLIFKLRRARFINCISEWHRRFYQELVLRPDADYPVVRCGVDMAEFAPVSHPPGDPPLVLGVGRLVPKKGFDVLIEATAQLMARGCAVKVVIAGDGPEMDRLVALRKKLGLESSVALPGACSNPQVREWLKSADLFVLPCRVDRDGDRDGIPVVLMEAMACGVCAVSGDLPTIRELIRHEVTGCMVDPGDVDELARTMEQLLSVPAHRRALADAGRRRVAEEFSLAVNVKRMLTWVQQ